MARIRSLELLFNLEKKNLKSKEDCVVAVLHCLIINENYECVGTGDEWPETDSVCTELLPENWNNNQDVYTLRYSSKDKKSRILLKAIKMEHILQVDAVMNEDAIASFPVPVNDHISDEYSEYSSAYKDLESLSKSFSKDIMECLKEPKEKKEPSKKSNSPPRNTIRSPLSRQPPPSNLEDMRDPFHSPRYPRIGGSDLDPFGGPGGGGMFMDPSNFGVPSRPTLPQFGVGGPGGLPRGAVPPGARFDPFMPPIRSDRRRMPDPDHFQPPDFEDFM